jgi:hypothetical protein
LFVWNDGEEGWRILLRDYVHGAGAAGAKRGLKEQGIVGFGGPRPPPVNPSLFLYHNLCTCDRALTPSEAIIQSVKVVGKLYLSAAERNGVYNSLPTWPLSTVA